MAHLVVKVPYEETPSSNPDRYGVFTSDGERIDSVYDVSLEMTADGFPVVTIKCSAEFETVWCAD